MSEIERADWRVGDPDWEGDCELRENGKYRGIIHGAEEAQRVAGLLSERDAELSLAKRDWNKAELRCDALRQRVDALTAALKNIVCGYCHNSIGWSGTHDATRNAAYGTLDWRTCPTCKAARAALADPAPQAHREEA